MFAPFEDLSMKLAKFSVTTLLLLSVAACGPGGKPPAGGPGAGMPQVSVVTVQPQKITLTTQLPGRTSAFRIAEIRPQVNGLIQKRLFTEGSEIKAGDVLYQIDPAPFQAALDNARAAMGRAEANLPSIKARADRFKELLADKAVRQEYV
jgi:membrane fusion protein (multidrug efflux system)